MKVKLKADRKAIQEFVVEHIEKIVFAVIVICFALIVYGATAAARQMAPKASATGAGEATPTALKSYAERAQQHWQKTQPEPEPPSNVIDMAMRSAERIDVVPYDFQVPLDRPLVEQRRPRGVPPLVTVDALQVTADRGQFSMMVEEQDSLAGTPVGSGGLGPRVEAPMRTIPMVRGQRWVVLTGLVKYRDQVQAFEEYYQTVQRRGQRDFPFYRGYVVQRAEVSRPDDDQPIDWSKSTTLYSGIAAGEAARRWGRANQMVSQLVDPMFVDKAPSLVFPLGPRVDGIWDKTVVHEPEIPIYESRYGQFMGEGTTTPEPGEKDPFAVRDPNRPLFYGPGPTAGPPMPPVGTEGPMPTGTGFRGDPRQVPEYQLFRFFDFSAEVRLGKVTDYSGSTGVATVQVDEDTRATLFVGDTIRIKGETTDFTQKVESIQFNGQEVPEATKEQRVQLKLAEDAGPNDTVYKVTGIRPGKHYRYRVRLVLWNPNLGMDARFLSKEVADEKKRIEDLVKQKMAENKEAEARAIYRQWELIESDWSEPSKVVSLPRDGRLLAVSVRPPARPGAEPSAKMMVVNWMPEEGTEGYIEEQLNRGKVANFLSRPLFEPQTKEDRYSSGPVGEGDGGYYGSLRGNQAVVEEAPVVDYLTDTLVLDIHGGERLPGKDRLAGPGAVLLLGPDGAMTVRNDVDDLRECIELEQQKMGPTGPGEDYSYPPGGYEGPMGPRSFDGNLNDLRRGRYPVPRGGARGTRPPGGSS